MAVRRPAAPRARRGDALDPALPPVPAAPVPAATAPAAPVPEVLPSATPAAPPSAAAPDVAPSAPAPAASPSSAPAARRGPGRRTVLLAGAAAAVVAVPVGVGTLLNRSGSALTASSAEGGTGAAPTSSPFADVADDAEDLAAMLWAHETGVQTALEGDAYAPDRTVTRGQLAVALHRFGGSPEVPVASTPTLFVDLGDDAEQTAALLWLHGRGALWGDAALQVHPDGDATLGCEASMLTALLRPSLAAVGVTWSPVTELAASEDAATAPDLLDLAWLVAAGMLPAGTTLGTGDRVLTRLDVARTLHQADAAITDATA